MNAIEFLVFTLATWRISSMLVEEDGLFEIFGRLRHRFGVRYDEHSYPYGKNELAKVFTCIWCISPWVGLGWMLFWLASPRIAFIIALPFALTAGLIIHGRGIRFRK